MTEKLEDFLEKRCEQGADDGLAAIVLAIADGARAVSALIGRGPLEEGLGSATGGRDEHGDSQKALDVVCDDFFVEALRKAPVAQVLSEERPDIVELHADAPWLVAIDPLDGSSNIDIDMSIGTIFGVVPNDRDHGFRQTGACQRAAGFVVYGPQTAIVFSIGQGVDVFILDRDHGAFLAARHGLRVEPKAREYAINTANRRHWSRGIARFVADCEAGREGPLGHDINLRWIASLVAETYRILMRGGVFLYPADARPGYGEGRLRLAYEANPIAFLMEQAGGAATDGTRRILDLPVNNLHQRTPLVFGSAPMVARIAGYLEAPI